MISHILLYLACEHIVIGIRQTPKNRNGLDNPWTNCALRSTGKYEIRTGGRVIHDKTGRDGVRASASIGDESHTKITPGGIYHNVPPDSGHLLYESPATSLGHVHIVEIVVAESQNGEREGNVHLAAERDSPPAVLARCVGLQPNAVEE